MKLMWWVVCFVAGMVSPVTAGNEIFRNPQLGLSFYAPGEWNIELIEASDTYTHADVGPADKRGFCGIHSFTTHITSVTEIADEMIEGTAAELAKDGLLQFVLERHDITTASGVEGVMVFVHMIDYGWSKRAYFLDGGVVHMIDCEATVKNWDEFVPAFDTVLSTFNIE